MARAKGPLENEHHNLPRSRGGSSHACNISTVLELRHNALNPWAWNLPPCALIRKLALYPFGLSGRRAFPPHAYEDIVMTINPSDWTMVYEPEAFVMNAVKKERARIRKAVHFSSVHLNEEHRDVVQTMGAIEFNQEYPIALDAEREKFLPRVFDFFGTRSPRETIRRLLTEEHKGELSWVKPIRANIRQNILRILDSIRLESLSAAGQHILLDVLEAQESELLTGMRREHNRREGT